jgi:hypothetical protein
VAVLAFYIDTVLAWLFLGLVIAATGQVRFLI